MSITHIHCNFSSYIVCSQLYAAENNVNLQIVIPLCFSPINHLHHTLKMKIESLPNELFQCKKLRTLNLGNNCLQSLPSRFGELTGLTQLELRGNRLECLPVELGECRQLKRTGLVVEEDLFNTLPTEVKEQLWKIDKEQAWTGLWLWVKMDINQLGPETGENTSSVCKSSLKQAVVLLQCTVSKDGYHEQEPVWQNQKYW